MAVTGPLRGASATSCPIVPAGEPMDTLPRSRVLTMTLAADTTLAARSIQLKALRRLDGPTRLEMACRMSDDARAVSEAGIRHRHPEWSDREVQRALLELLLGPELAKRVSIWTDGSKASV